MKYASQVSRETIARLEAMAAEDPVRCQPHPCPGVYSSREEEEFWCYKCWGHALEQPMPGSNLAEFFRQQDLQFPLPAGFREERRITVSHGSDCMAVDCICDAYTPHLFDSIADFYLTTDLPTANLESTVYPAAPFGRNQPKVLPGQTRTDCNPRMNTSAGMLDRFVNAGIRYFSTANNHCYDYDEAGLLATLDELDRRGAAHSGTNRSPQEQTQALVLDVGGVRVAELSATFDLNDRAYEKKWLLNEVRFNDTPCDFTLMEQLIASAKAQKADIITLHAHWGWEFELYPHPKTVEYAHKLAEMGIDVIVGTHPHVSQPMEKYTYTQNGEQRSCLIFYSLGDFVSFHPQSRDSRITSVICALSSQTSDYLMYNSFGEMKYETRPMTTVQAMLVADNGSRKIQKNVSRSLRKGAEMLTDALITELAGKITDGLDNAFEAVRPKGGQMQVVMGAGASGILLHEAMGHAFEADFNRKGQSIFSDKMGKRVCPEGINIVDDATIRGNRGSLNFDDEGVPGQRTTMVEDGILTSYLHDRISARYYSVAPTGNGRRETFRSSPIPRMRATYMESGNAEPDGIIASVRKGIYVNEFSNGQVKIGEGDFTFFVKSGFLIEDGRLTRPIKDINVIGNGPQALKDIMAVGNDCVIDDSAWTCGKGQSVPVSCGMPTVLVNNLLVGGEQDGE